MSRYIDADFVVNECDEFDIADGLMRCISGATTPTIDIVRCRECKYAEVADPTDDQDGYMCQFHRGSIWFSGSFCSWGEREGE